VVIRGTLLMLPFFCGLLRRLRPRSAT